MVVGMAAADAYREETAFTDDIPLQADAGWLGHTDNVTKLEYYPNERLKEYDVTTVYRFDGTKYVYPYRMGQNPGCLKAEVVPMAVEDINEARKNTNDSRALFYERANIEESAQVVRFYYAIYLEDDVTYAYRDRDYGVGGYASQAVNDGKGNLHITYTPSPASFALVFFTRAWVIFALLAITIFNSYDALHTKKRK
jgi:hypothetical protein